MNSKYNQKGSFSLSISRFEMDDGRRVDGLEHRLATPLFRPTNLATSALNVNAATLLLIHLEPPFSNLTSPPVNITFLQTATGNIEPPPEHQSH
jgi:hypothetical protein